MTRLDHAPLPKKSPRQARAQATYDAILQAAAHILTEGGPTALTTNLVAEHAGVSIGSLYQYFPSKEAIVAELIRDLRRQMLDDIRGMAAFVEGQPLRFAVARMIRASIHHHVHTQGRAEVLEQLEHHLPFDTETEAIKTQIIDLVAALLDSHGIEQPRHAAFDMINLVVGMAHPALHVGETDYEALALRIERAALGYLGLNTSGSVA
ncbi:TetR/AcrR family transcriptional regulator [Celeribacter arenosi]|uniref:TetR/AcrR family transcriptional regulator n=1 Tax=Celeribacter arenosi TaxID=792649 RepID=A0ABP7K767_9RHOB